MPMRTGEATTMTEIPNPRVPAVEPPVAAGAVELRRFHFSGPEPGAAPRIGALLPAGRVISDQVKLSESPSASFEPVPSSVTSALASTV